MKRQTATDPILIVEADDDLREATLTLLPMNDYRAIAVHNGVTALRMLRAGLRPCLILLDLIVPGDGWKFRMEQVADPEMAQLPVIGGATIKATQDHIDPALRVDDILMKPFDLDALFALFDRHCVAAQPG